MSQVSLNGVQPRRVIPRDQSHRPGWINIYPGISEKKLKAVNAEVGTCLTKMRDGFYEGLYAETVNGRYLQTRGIVSNHEIGVKDGKVYVEVTFDNGVVLSNQNPANLILLLRRAD